MAGTWASSPAGRTGSGWTRRSWNGFGDNPCEAGLNEGGACAVRISMIERHGKHRPRKDRIGDIMAGQSMAQQNTAEQNYSNHARLVPMFHFVLLPLLLLTCIG